MEIGEIRDSIGELENEITSSKEIISDKVEKLKCDLKDLKNCIGEKDREIAELKNENAELGTLFKKALAYIDQKPLDSLLDELSDIQVEVKSLLANAKAKPEIIVNRLDADVSVLTKPAKAEGSPSDLAEDHREWAKSVLERAQSA